MKKLTCFLLLAVIAFTAHSQIVTSIVGNGVSGYSGDGGQATAAEIKAIMGIATDTFGCLYIADQGNQRVRKVNTAGIISTFAGTGTAGFSGDGGQATAAKLSSPIDIAFDRWRNVFIVDKSNNRIRKVNASGVISTIAGNGTAGYSGDGGQATAAEISNARGITIDTVGNIYFADLGNNVVRKINTSGVISTFAGNGVSGYSGDGAQATAAEINNVQRVVVDKTGNIYIADGSNARIRKVNTSGVISTFAGTGTAGYSGTGGPATAAKIYSPHGMTFDKSGNMYFTNIGNNRTEKINTSNTISLIAGNGVAGYSGDGGQSAAAEFNSPDDVAPELRGNLYIGDASNNRIRLVYLVLKVTTNVTANVSCYGGSNGSASCTTSNGTTPYTYAWTSSITATSSTVTGLSAGTYTVTVTDADGITGTAAVTIGQPDSPLTVSASTTANVSCYGGSNGSVSATPIGGTSPYTYSWSGGGTNSTKTGLTAGTYTITVTDNNGCTASAVAEILQPAALAPTIVWAKNATCAGTFDGMTLATASGGTMPYTYSWSPGGATTAEITGLGAGTYTLTVTDANGCTGSTSANITQPPALTVTTINVLSIAYSVITGGTPPYSYSWTPGGSTTALLTGASAGTYTVTVTDANSCVDSAIITLTSTVKIPKLHYPRWSKRGVYLEFAPHYYSPINSGDSIRLNGTPFVTYCRNNHITYVVMDGVDYLVSGPFANSCGVFYQDSAFVNATNAPYLENFIDSLKTRGGVEEVGIICYNSDPGYPDSNSYSVKNFDVANFSESARLYNIGIPWVKKVDVLSLDDEFWNYPSTQLSQSLAEFHSIHMPMLKSMYRAAHECDANFMRVEDYDYFPLNPNNTSFVINDPTDTMEADSIALYADRILNSCYTGYPFVTWNEADFRLAYPNFGKNANRKIEIWPAFGAENQNGGCTHCYEPGSGDGLGDSMCYQNRTPDALEQQYFDSLVFSENHQVYTSSISNPTPMGADTNFIILGNMWYQYECLKHFNFDTNVNTGAIHFYVTAGPDTIWTGSNRVLKATPHMEVGGTVYAYLWYNLNNQKDIFLTANPGTINTYTATAPARYAVIAVGIIGTDTVTAIDYMNLYSDTCGPTSVPSIPKPAVELKIYPNPSHGVFTVEMMNDYGRATNLCVYNIMGEEVKSEELRENSSLLDLTEQPSGVYFCRLTDKSGTLLKSTKIMVIH